MICPPSKSLWKISRCALYSALYVGSSKCRNRLVGTGPQHLGGENIFFVIVSLKVFSRHSTPSEFDYIRKVKYENALRLASISGNHLQLHLCNEEGLRRSPTLHRLEPRWCWGILPPFSMLNAVLLTFQNEQQCGSVQSLYERNNSVIRFIQCMGYNVGCSWLEGVVQKPLQFFPWKPNFISSEAGIREL